MPIFFTLENLDDYFHSLPPSEIKLLNHLDYNNQDDFNLVAALSQQSITDDIIQIDATCMCGQLSGNYRQGNICPHCNTVVKDRVQDFDPILWVHTKPPIETFISPAFVAEFEYILTQKVGNISIFRWLTDKKYNPNKTIKKSSYISRIINTLTTNNVERNYNYFINNIPEIITLLMSSITDQQKIALLLELKERYMQNRDKLYSNYLPILNRKFLIVEKNSKGNYTDSTMFTLKDVILTLFRNMSTDVSEERLLTSTANTIKKLADMYINIHAKYLSKKPGLFRKLIGGLRGAFTFRNTIIPIPDEHDVHTCVLPWGSAVIVLEYYIVNILFRQGFTPLEIRQKLKSAVNNFDPDISKALDLILEKAKEGMGGLYVHINRNPVQGVYGSFCALVSHIDRDPNVRGLRVSGVTISYPNGDFEA